MSDRTLNDTIEEGEILDSFENMQNKEIGSDILAHPLQKNNKLSAKRATNVIIVDIEKCPNKPNESYKFRTMSKSRRHGSDLLNRSKLGTMSKIEEFKKCVFATKERSDSNKNLHYREVRLHRAENSSRSLSHEKENSKHSERSEDGYSNCAKRRRSLPRIRKKTSRHRDDDDCDNKGDNERRSRKRRHKPNDGDKTHKESERYHNSHRSRDRYPNRAVKCARSATKSSVWPSNSTDDSHLKDNVLMRKLLQSGSISRHSSSSDLSCEIGSLSSITSPEYDDCLNSLSLARDGQRTEAASATRLDCEGRKETFSDDSEIEVIIPPPKPPPLLIELNSDNEEDGACSNECVTQTKQNETIEYTESSQSGVVQMDADQTKVVDDSIVNQDSNNVDGVPADCCTKSNANQEAAAAAAEDDLDDLQLRLVALRSAVLKKHQERLKRKEINKENDKNNSDKSIETDKNTDTLENVGSDTNEDVYHPSNQTSPMSPTSSYNFSPTQECHAEQDIDIDSQSESELVNNDDIIVESQAEDHNFVYPSYDCSNSACFPNVGAAGVSWELQQQQQNSLQSQHVALPPQPLPPGVDASNLPPEFTHSVFSSCPPEQNQPIQQTTSFNSENVADPGFYNSNPLQTPFYQPTNFYNHPPMGHPIYVPPLQLTSSCAGQPMPSNITPEQMSSHNVPNTFQNASLFPDISQTSRKECQRQLEPCMPTDETVEQFSNHASVVRHLEPCLPQANNILSNDHILPSSRMSREDNLGTKTSDEIFTKKSDQVLSFVEDSFAKKSKPEEISIFPSKTSSLPVDKRIESSIRSEKSVDSTEASSTQEDLDDENEEILRARALTSLSKKSALKGTSLGFCNNPPCISDSSSNPEKIPNNTIDSIVEQQNPSRSAHNVAVFDSRTIFVAKSLLTSGMIEDVSPPVKQNPVISVNSNMITPLNRNVNVAQSLVVDKQSVLKVVRPKQSPMKRKTLNKVFRKDLQKNRVINRTSMKLKNCDIVVSKFSNSSTCRNFKKKDVLSSVKKPASLVLADHSQSAESGNKFIISLGQDSEDSTGEDVDNEGNSAWSRQVVLSKSTMVAKDATEISPVVLDKRIDELLQEVRKQHEVLAPVSPSSSGILKNKVQNVNVPPARSIESKSPNAKRMVVVSAAKVSAPPKSLNSTANSSTPAAVKHLPKSAQEEYRRLKQAMAAKENLKKLEAAQNNQQLKRKAASCTSIAISAQLVSPTPKAASPDEAAAADVVAQSQSMPAEVTDNSSNPGLTCNEAVASILSEAEEKLVNERYTTLDKLVELDAKVSRVELMITRVALAEEEVARMRSRLAAEEKQLIEEQSALAESISCLKACSELSEQSLMLCSDIERTCSELGGSNYKLPSAGKDLLKTRSEDVLKKRESVLGVHSQKRTVKLGDNGKMEVIVNTIDRSKCDKDEDIDEETADGPTVDSNQQSCAIASSSAKCLPDYVSPLNYLQCTSSSRNGPATGRVESKQSIFCPYDLMGSCRDEKCPYQH